MWDNGERKVTFTVTYRDKTGIRRETSVEAASREAAFAAARTRGISPLSIRAGARAAGSKGKDDNGPSGVKGFKGLLAAIALLALLGGVAWWWLDGTSGTPSPTVAVKGDKNPNGLPPPKKLKDDSGLKGDNDLKGVKDDKGRKGDKVAKRAKGDKVLKDLDVPDDTNVVAIVEAETNTVFKTSSDQMFTLLAPADGTDAPPPPAPSPDIERQFRKSLNQKIEILDTDSAEIRTLKQLVIESRAEMKRLIESGMSFEEVVREHQKLAGENNAIRREMLSELNRLIESGDTEGAIAYRKRINEALGQMGIAPLKTAITDEERAERAAERRERRRQRKLKAEEN